MSQWSIIHKNGPAPPGGWPFTDPRTGQVFPGMNYSYQDLMYAIANHRRANPRIYPAHEPQYLDTDFISSEYDAWRCKSLGYDGSFCKDLSAQPSPIPTAVEIQQSGSSCPKCGETTATPKFCPTCSGHRLLGWICSKCGFYRSK
jgi:hypothetical protein